MLVKKQKTLHCPNCQGELGVEPKHEYKYVTQRCRHCKKMVVVYWKCGVKLSKY